MEVAGTVTERQEPFLDVLRELMAAFTSPIVPGLPRFTGGAVGYFDYDAAEWFEPAVALDKPPRDRDQAAFMVFDTILAFDHVKHRILAIANARLRAGRGSPGPLRFRVREDRFPRARARAQSVAAASSRQARR